MKIIGFCGVIGSGKDYQGELLVNQGCVKLSFADIMRKAMWTILGWSPKTNTEYDIFKNSDINLEDKLYNRNRKLISFNIYHTITGRALLQRFGTEFGRNMLGEDFWVELWVKEIAKINSDIVVTDVRFKNELLKILELGGEVIFCNYKSQRYSVNEDLSKCHPSEWLGNRLIQMGYNDLQKITLEDIGEIYGTKINSKRNTICNCLRVTG